MPDFARGRMNPGLAPDELNSALAAIVATFGLGWLKGQADHPIRQLWKREDFLATCELFWLGSAILDLQQLDATWIARHVQKIKKGNRNERVGSMFEILGLGMFRSHAGGSVTPAPRSQQAYDAEISAAGQAPLRVSIKNFGASSFQHDVERAGRDIEKFLISNAPSWKVHWIGAVIEATRYPSAEDWRRLRQAIVDAPPYLLFPLVVRADPWNIAWHGPSSPPALDERRLSYALRIFVPHHPNEKRNIKKKLVTACAELSAYAKGRPGSSNIVLMRVAEGFSVNDLKTWASELMAEEAAPSGVDALLLYQPAVTVDPERDTTQLSHHVAAVTRRPCRFPFDLVVPVGVISTNPVRYETRVGGFKSSLEGRHCYQRGEIYEVYPWSPTGQLSFSIRSLAPGARSHAVARAPTGEGIILSGKFPPSLDFALFT